MSAAAHKNASSASANGNPLVFITNRPATSVGGRNRAVEVGRGGDFLLQKLSAMTRFYDVVIETVQALRQRAGGEL